jgi:hypothetical protein
MHSSYGHAPSHVSDDTERTRNLFDVKIIIFLRIRQVHTQTLNTYAHSPLWIHVRKLYTCKHLRNTVPAHLEIDAGASLSTGTSPTTKNTTLLNPGIWKPKFLRFPLTNFLAKHAYGSACIIFFLIFPLPLSNSSVHLFCFPMGFVS